MLFENLLDSWGAVSLLSTVAIVVSALTVQLSYIVRRKEAQQRGQMRELEEAKLRLMQTMETKQQHQIESLKSERRAVTQKLVYQQLDLLKAELDRIQSPDEENRINAARQIVSMIETSLKSLDEV